MSLLSPHGYGASSPGAGPSYEHHGQQYGHAPPPPPVEKGKEELARATKDLMMGLDDETQQHRYYDDHYPPNSHYAPRSYSIPFPAYSQVPPPKMHINTSLSHPHFPHSSTNVNPAVFAPPAHSPSPPEKRPSPSAYDGPPSQTRKRSRTSPPDPSPSTSNAPANPPQPSPQSQSHPQPQQTQPQPQPAKPPGKQSALLTPSQKKANHIQSEQKRRANIRRGYEALCSIVPALREAIANGDTEFGAGDDDEDDREVSTNGKGKAKVKKPRPRKRKGAAAVDDDTKDGRAGPKSEGVVLSKTIDYINTLLYERDSLIQRLERASSMLPPNYSQPHLNGSETPLWQRPWNGGTGMDPDADPNEDDDEGEDDTQL